jgi:hypothetical protein
MLPGYYARTRETHQTPYCFPTYHGHNTVLNHEPRIARYAVVLYCKGYDNTGGLLRRQRTELVSFTRDLLGYILGCPPFLPHTTIGH